MSLDSFDDDEADIGLNGALARSLREMTPLDRGYMLMAGTHPTIVALIATLKLPVEFPTPTKKDDQG